MLLLCATDSSETSLSAQSIHVFHNYVRLIQSQWTAHTGQLPYSNNNNNNQKKKKKRNSGYFWRPVYYELKALIKIFDD